MIRPTEAFYPTLIGAVLVIGLISLVSAKLRVRRANREIADRKAAGSAAR